MKKVIKYMILLMFSLSLFGCGNKEKVIFKYGTYGIESEGVSSSWAMTKYVFDHEGIVSIYVLNNRVEDELNIYEYDKFGRKTKNC